MTPQSVVTPPTTNKVVVVVGAINVDLVVAAEHLPRPGETVVGPRLERHGGGKGANAAVAAARAGAKVRLIGAVGADDTGRSAVEELRTQGIDVGGIAVLPDEATGVALIVVDPRGENQIAVGAGANSAVTAQQVSRALAEVRGQAGCVLVSTEIPEAAIVAAVEEAISLGVPCILNPAPVVPAVLRLLQKGPLLTPNATELTALVAALENNLSDARADGKESIRNSHDDLRTVTEGARKLVAITKASVVVTMGGQGALIVSPEADAEHLPAPPAVVRDTTGAGDTFNGVLATRLAAGEHLGDAVRTAIVAASLSVAHAGARAGMPTAALISAQLYSS
ncbi:MAG TPA: PfkB family carbohydrate kinase [Candidatus Binataceae bacterium]|nr:PfkB family carbohydrate kinase [Candidatus Binataceae bacterium]